MYICVLYNLVWLAALAEISTFKINTLLVLAKHFTLNAHKLMYITITLVC